MTKLTEADIKSGTEYNIFYHSGFVGFPPSSDAVLAYRGLSSVIPEEKILYAIGLNNTESGFSVQSATIKALSLSLKDVIDTETRNLLETNAEIIFRGESDTKLQIETLNFALKAIRQRQDRV